MNNFSFTKVFHPEAALPLGGAGRGALILLIVMTLFISCTSKEQSTINKITDLTEKVEKANDPSSLDWEELAQDYETIMQDASECNFSEEESKEFFKQQGKFYAAMTKYAVKSIPGLMNNVMDAASDFMDGFTDGLNE